MLKNNDINIVKKILKFNNKNIVKNILKIDDIKNLKQENDILKTEVKNNSNIEDNNSDITQIEYNKIIKKKEKNNLKINNFLKLENIPNITNEEKLIKNKNKIKEILKIKENNFVKLDNIPNIKNEQNILKYKLKSDNINNNKNEENTQIEEVKLTETKR
jgi:hypothetical protein